MGASMQMTIVSVTFFIGLALIIAAIFGGGLEIKEVKIPTLAPAPRVMSFVAGSALIALCLVFPQTLSSWSSASSQPAATTGTTSTPFPNPADNTKGPPFLGAAIKNNLITVREVKVILRHAGKYNGPIDDEVNPAYFQAVAEFQVSQNIDPDGYVGPVTYAKLRESWPDYFTSARK